jgi:predicted nuclease of restriction endonuclease-like (RecB) superfamily
MDSRFPWENSQSGVGAYGTGPWLWDQSLCTARQGQLRRAMSDELTPSVKGYAELFDQLKARIESARLRASFAVNRELVLLYWSIGRDILDRQARLGWGAKVVDQLAADLRRAFPEMRGFSPRNLKYMRAFAEAWPDEQIVQQAVAQIPWGHNVRLLDRVADPAEREWYVRQIVEYGWSRNVLVHQIESKLYERQGRALTNFDRSLPAPQSELAQQVLKDPYVFDFFPLGPEARERDLERGLLDHIRHFLLELGVGFAFVGSQYRLEVGGQDYYLDLLFYHLKLRAFIVVDLKIGEFEPEHAGKMGFYLQAVDDLLRHHTDQPSVGLILCKTKNEVIVEYSLKSVDKPVGVSSYRLAESLPEPLKGSLPTIEQLEAELAGDGEAESEEGE